MKVKLFDEEHDLDLEDSINAFLEEFEGRLLSIQFNTNAFCIQDEQVYSFSALLLYE